MRSVKQPHADPPLGLTIALVAFLSKVADPAEALFLRVGGGREIDALAKLPAVFVSFTLVLRQQTRVTQHRRHPNI